MSQKSLQTIAAEWHSGQSSALYAYANAGTIKAGLRKEIVDCFPSAKAKELAELKRLFVAISPVPTKQEVIGANEFWSRLYRNADGSPIRARRSGKTQVWKTRPDDFKQPVKYGLKQSFYITPGNIGDWVIAP